MTLKETYIGVGRGSRGRREEPPRHRQAPSRQRRDGRWEDDWDKSPKGKTKQMAKGKKRRRSWLASLGIRLYKMLVLVSVLIVGAYLGLQLMSEAPDQNPSPSGTGDPASSGTGADGTDATRTDPDALVRRKDVYTILLAATDYEGIRTDTMMVMTYDIPNQKVGVISIPRDTLTRREAGKNPKLVYGPGGVDRRVEDISNMLGFPIDNYVKVDIKGFIALVDYMGGVDFYVPCDMNYDDPYQNLYIHYREGQHHLNGQQAMEVARFRHNNDGSGYTDVGRTQTQQALLVALAKKVLAWNSLTKINGFVEIFNEYVDTDLTLSNMMYFAQYAINLDLTTSVETATLEGRGDGSYRGNVWCFELDPQKTVDTVNRLVNPYTRDLTLEDMDLIRAESYHEY